jgi:NAD+ synthase (glutamine-hydrolysing)
VFFPNALKIKKDMYMNVALSVPVKPAIMPDAMETFTRQSPSSQSPSKGATVIPFSQRLFDGMNIRFGNIRRSPEATNPLLNPALTLNDFEAQVNALVASPQKRAEKIHQLTEVVDAFLQDQLKGPEGAQKLALVTANLKTQLGPRGQGNTIMAQINPTIGDLEGNAKKIMAYIDIAEQIGADSVVFPELSLMGYPVQDVIKRHPFLVEENVKWLKAIAARCKNTRAMVGFVEPRKPRLNEKAEGKEFYNAMAVMGNGQIEGLVRKSLLPTYGEFDDYRTFEFSGTSGVADPSTLGQASDLPDDVPTEQQGKPFEIFKKQYGLTICEDTWNDKEFITRPYYKRDPVAEVAAHKPDMMVNISASPTKSRKEQMKHAMLSYQAKTHGIPYVYVNQVGSMDDISFDGTSRAYDKDGQLIARAKAFKEQFMFVNPLNKEGVIEVLPKGLEETIGAKKVYDPYDTSDMGRMYESIVQSIRDYYKKTGQQKAVLGLSGGLDSAVCAVLLVDALGKDNVIGVSMPYGPISPEDSKTDAADLARNLGIQMITHDITAEVDTAWTNLGRTFNAVQPAWTRAGTPQRAATTKQNLQARTRATVLWSMGNEFKQCMPIATSDKSELYLGYATINGDMSGGYAPIGDVLKTKVRLLAKWMNENRPEKGAIPDSTVTKPSGADLEIDPKTGKPMTAEDDNMPYEFLDEIIYRIHNNGESYQEMMASPFWLEQKFIEKGTPLSQETKELWMKRFFWKMSSAFYKWSIFPPSPLLEGDGTINKKEYRQPVTCRVNWFGTQPGDLDKVLDALPTKQINRVAATL